MTTIAEGTRRVTKNNLRAAMHHNSLFSMRGLQERIFTLAFSGLVYAQIWEDPLIDMEALQIGQDDHVVAIASGGCNGMSYLLADPKRVTLVDLNEHHVALTKLKQISATALPDYAAFYSFFGDADKRENLVLYERFLRPKLDPSARAYWQSRDWRGRRRISYFANRLYRHGLLGVFIGAGHLIARAHGIRLAELLEAKDLSEQRRVFDERIRPIFAKKHVKWLTRRSASLYGLGIPPAQYEALLSSATNGQGMAEVLERRIERLACGFDIKHNYFAWQAFGRSYMQDGAGPLPPYLQAENFHLVRSRANKINVCHVNFVDFLRRQPDASLGCYSLLDAQDWMTTDLLNALWREITRTAKPGARVIFRTAGDNTILPGQISDQLLQRWHYNRDKCRNFTLRDRSSIYGGFHLYTFKG